MLDFSLSQMDLPGKCSYYLNMAINIINTLHPYINIPHKYIYLPQHQNWKCFWSSSTILLFLYIYVWSLQKAYVQLYSVKITLMLHLFI